MTDESMDAWFEREVLSHDLPLTIFLSRLWSRRDDLGDVRQEAYLRVYEAAKKSRLKTPKAFLFATARNLVIDMLRRERSVRFLTFGINDAELEILIDEITPERQFIDHVHLVELQSALTRLPTRAREVVWLRRVENLSQREVAERLRISEKTVEKHLRCGTRQLAEVMREPS